MLSPQSSSMGRLLDRPENELAMAAAQAMARGERDGISPLVVYGPSGVGKSRLLAGLVAEWLLRHPGSSVAHLDAQTFGAACLEAAAVAGGVGWSALRGRFRSVQLFVLEDIEGLARGPLARDELAHTLDALDATGAAVAFSARSRLATWPRKDWPRRLVNRLMGGLASRIARRDWHRGAGMFSSVPASRCFAPGRGRRNAGPSWRWLSYSRWLDLPAGTGRAAQA